jgi:hypothetical protein
MRINKAITLSKEADELVRNLMELEARSYSNAVEYLIKKGSGKSVKKTRFDYKSYIDLYHEKLPNNTKVGTLTDSRKTKLRNFVKKNKFTVERFSTYLDAINQHCKWMTESYQTNQGNTRICKFDYFISDRCYAEVKDAVATNGE